MPELFPTLFSPTRIGSVLIKNRIVSTGHDTVMPENGLVTPTLIAYQEARAAGGTGLIIVQVAGIHESARYTSHMLMADSDACIEGLSALADRCHHHGAKVFIQLFHPGRELMEGPGGLLVPALSASATPSERFRSMPRAMSSDDIQTIIQCYGEAAARMVTAGLDGVEILAGFGYLPGQFLDPRINRRDDAYGPDGDNRFRFLTEVIQSIRQHTPDTFVTGIRLSSADQDDEGLSTDEVLETIQVIAPSVDYLHVVSGTSATLGGAIHIAPPMAYPNGYLAPFARQVKQLTDTPVIVTGRINQPQIAESILANGSADLCGMTRALISDPEMPSKASTGRADEIRACIGCNQACIGHFHKGVPVSCIQRPETGRELRYGRPQRAAQRKTVLVAGGGPAGIKAALTLAARGHSVHLHEAAARLGGAALLAQQLPRRAEFGGLVTTLRANCRDPP
jgi:2,4-dienoyl-CoA reductase-like NADH-dependent reductase (Old Yellow Enzyme family)